jgi:hypothetical protein
MVGWYWQGKRRASLVHRLVLLAFHGEPPPGYEARHVNGVLTNNRADNLAWGPRAVNLEDQRRHGTCVWKLDLTKAREIRAKRAEGGRTGELAREYGVSRRTILAVLECRTYKEVRGMSEFPIHKKPDYFPDEVKGEPGPIPDSEDALRYAFAPLERVSLEEAQRRYPPRDAPAKP